MRIDSNPTSNPLIGLSPKSDTAAGSKNASGEPVRGVDTVSFSRYVIRTRAQVRADAALATAQTSPVKAQQSLASTAAAPTQSPATPDGKLAPDTKFAPAAQADQTVKTSNFITDAVKRVYGQQDLDAVLAAWGQTRGDRGYNAIADANNDGVVDFEDQNYILTNWGQPVPGGESIPAPDLTGPFSQEHLDAIKERFGAKAGEDRYLLDADANGDGVIDFDDISHVIANWGAPRTPPASE